MSTAPTLANKRMSGHNKVIVWGTRVNKEYPTKTPFIFERNRPINTISHSKRQLNGRHRCINRHLDYWITTGGYNRNFATGQLMSRNEPNMYVLRIGLVKEINQRHSGWLCFQLGGRIGLDRRQVPRQSRL